MFLKGNVAVARQVFPHLFKSHYSNVTIFDVLLIKNFVH